MLLRELPPKQLELFWASLGVIVSMDCEGLETFTVPLIGLVLAFNGLEEGPYICLVPRGAFTEIGGMPFPGFLVILGIIIMPSGWGWFIGPICGFGRIGNLWHLSLHSHA